MSEIALRTYIEQVDNLVDRKQFDEAIAHCRHILTFYPKHLDAYRMLGKALLEKGRHSDASDIFQRVLSAAPDDFIAHVGMSIIREDEANLEAALWHMERAFEANPANGGVQQELCRLYGRRDGVVPPRARMTRGALARMYAHGGLFLQAEAELKAALKAEPERVDLATVLAQVFWETDQQAEAAETCSTILKRLPYSKEANRILSDILRAQGRQDDADAFRQRLIALDPYEAKVEPAANGRGAASVEANNVVVSRLDYSGGVEEPGAPDWITSIGAKFQESSEGETPSPGAPPDWMATLQETPPTLSATQEMPHTAELPDWLKDLQPPDEGAVAPAAAEAEVQPEAAEAPDWLGALGIATSAGAAAASTEEPVPDWLKAATGPLSPEALPDWMTETTAAAAPALSAREAEELPPLAEVAPPEDLPDWLKTAAPAAPALAEDLPEWMRTKPIAPTPEAEIPEWMQGAVPATSKTELPVPSQLQEPPPPAPIPAPEVALTPAEATPDWLKTAMPPAAAGAVPDWMQTTAAPTPEEELPEWLKAATAGLPSEALPDWLTQPKPSPAAPALSEVEGPAQAAETAAPAVPPPAEELAPAEEIPEWMQAAAPAAAEDLPEWMRPAAPTPAVQAPVEAAAEIELPDWMKAMAPAAAPPEGELPDWMKAAVEPTPADELPDWMKATAPPPTAALTDAEKPEWLKQMEAEADTYEAQAQGQPAPPAPEPARPAVELPDFLQLASAEAIERASQPVAFDEEASAEEEEVPIAEPGEIPDWLKAMAPPSPEPLPPAPASPPQPLADLGPTPGLASMGADEGNRWVEGLTPEHGPEPEEAVGEVQEQTVESPEWLRKPSEREGEKPPTDLPPWAQAQEPGASDTIVTWLAGKQLPEWLRSPGEEAAPPPVDWLRAPAEEAPLEEEEAWPAPPTSEPQAGPETPSVPPAGGQDFAAMSADEAMRWLEGLAMQQGARPEEMVTQPEERPSEPAAWVAAEQPAVPTMPEAPVEIPEPTTATPSIEQPLAAAAAEVSMMPETSAGVPPDLAAMSADEALAWLEGLAMQHGARPEEMVTQPEERPSQPPAWIAAQQPAAPAPPELPAEIPQPEEEAPSIEPALAEADLTTGAYADAFVDAPTPASMDELDLTGTSADEALRWLEGLAVQPGAEPKDLVTAPEELATEPPAWTTPQPPAEAALPEEAVGALPSQGPAAPVESPLDLGTDETLSWLESLAAQQGARPEELLTAPESRAAEPPAWIRAAQPPAVEAEPQAIVSEQIEVSPPVLPADRTPAEAPPEEEIPAWLAASVEAAPDTLTLPLPPVPQPSVEAPAPAPVVPEPAAETPPTADEERLSRLAGRLADKRRAKEADIEARFASQRAQQEAARQAVEQKMEQRRAQVGTTPLTRAGTGPLAAQPTAPPSPPAEPIAQATPEPPMEAVSEIQPAPVLQAPAAGPAIQTVPPPRAETKPKAPLRSRKGRIAKSPYTAELPENVLMIGRRYISEQNYEAASFALGYLVETGQMMDDVIQEIEGFAGPRRGSAPLLRVLGDAYMRNNRLQKALDAYRLALGQL